MEKEHFTVKMLPESDTPYERFGQVGPEGLSDAELLAIIIKSGGKEETAVELSERILSHGNKSLLNLYDLSCEELMEFKGIGKVKAIQLKCVAELSKRLSRTNYRKSTCFDSSSKIADYFMEALRHEKREMVVALYLDCHMQCLSEETLNTGSTSYAYFPIAEILRRALLKNADCIVVLHNHPSGDPYPSGDDVRITGRIADGAKLLGLELTDHIIIGDRNYFSFRESHILEEI